MVIKVIPKKSNNNPIRLAQYLLKNTKDTKERLVASKFINCSFKDNDKNMLEMDMTQQLNTRAKGDKTMHLVISLREKEFLTQPAFESIAKEIADLLGMSDHQMLYAIHNDTNNLHMHLMINTIHPRTKSMRTPYRVFPALQDLAAALEYKFGLEPDNHSKSNNTYLFNDKTEEFKNWCIENVREDLKVLLADKNTSFKDIQYFLADFDLELKERRRGFTLSSKSKKLFIKASLLDRNLSKTSLEKRFGKLVLLDIKSKVKINTTLPSQSTRLYQMYQKIEEAKYAKKLAALAEIKKQRNDLQRYYEEHKPLWWWQKDHLRESRAVLNKKQKELFKKEKKLSFDEYVRQRASVGCQLSYEYLQRKRIAKLKKENYIQTNHNLRPDFISKQGFFIYKLSKYNKLIDKGDGLEFVALTKLEDKDILLFLKLINTKKLKNTQLHGNKDFINRVCELAAKYNFDVSFKDKALNKEIQILKRGLGKKIARPNKDLGLGFD